MNTRLTLFKAILVQDSALSVSGLDRESTSDQPFTLISGVPTLVGRGLKGAAVAMAKRFFTPLPRAVSDDVKKGALRRSAWEFADAAPVGRVAPRLRAGVGLRHKTGARAGGVLYDREVIPTGTKWELSFRVDRSYTVNENEFAEAEGILGYVLSEHWAKGRCWLGGGAARGLGWCHIEQLTAYRFDKTSYDAWVTSGRSLLPSSLAAVPTVSPTRAWCFRTLDVDVSFGEYKPETNEPAWGLDMFTVGPHDTEANVQPIGDRKSWATPAWAPLGETPGTLSTNRALLMEGDRPLLPGASVRGQLRHAFSRWQRAGGKKVEDPHLVQGKVGEGDPAGKAFGTVIQSSRILIRDARAENGWAAAKLHMHAEDEFSAGAYESSKRDAVRLLRGTFPVRIVVEGSPGDELEELVMFVNHLVALGELGCLPVGGHKTRGAGWGQWRADTWDPHDVKAERTWKQSDMPFQKTRQLRQPFPQCGREIDSWVRSTPESFNDPNLHLGESTKAARLAFGDHALVAWWCEPTIDLALTTPPSTFGRVWPEQENILVDEVAFYAERAVWRAVRTSTGVRSVFIEEFAERENGAEKARVVNSPARLHSSSRFSAPNTGRGDFIVREWHVDGKILGFTITQEQH